jgi:hypothetical protein
MHAHALPIETAIARRRDGYSTVLAHSVPFCADQTFSRANIAPKIAQNCLKLPKIEPYGIGYRIGDLRLYNGLNSHFGMPFDSMRLTCYS